MDAVTFEQAIFDRSDQGPPRLRACSPGCSDGWLLAAEKLCAGFGTRSEGVACPECVFAHPLTKDRVAVVQVADQPLGSASAKALAFRFIVVPRAVYERFLGDPFFIADRLPPKWNDTNPLPSLTWPCEPPTRRTVVELHRILRPQGDGAEQGLSQAATLLGGTQALIDGSRLVLERPAPDATLLRDLWMLLPTHMRCQLWPASFAFGNALGFHVLVVPRAEGDEFAGYLTEDQAGDYPEGRYESALQHAVERNDQRRLDQLLARRTPAQTLRLGIVILIATTVILVAASLLNRAMAPPRAAPPAGATSPKKR